MEINISDLTWESSVYPRGGKNEKTVEAYVEALTIGAQFPPIKIQRIFNYTNGNEKTEAALILDGIHRWLAFKKVDSKRYRRLNGKTNPLITKKTKQPFSLNQPNATSAMVIV